MFEDVNIAVCLRCGNSLRCVDNRWNSKHWTFTPSGFCMHISLLSTKPAAGGQKSDTHSLSAEDLIMAVHKASTRRIEVLSRTTGNVDQVSSVVTSVGSCTIKISDREATGRCCECDSCGFYVSHMQISWLIRCATICSPNAYP